MKFNRSNETTIAKNDFEIDNAFNDDYYELPNTLKSIIVIDNCKLISEFIPFIFNHKYIGFDMEWGTCKIGTGSMGERLSLIQLAIDTHAFLIDMVKLENDNYFENFDIQLLLASYFYPSLKNPNLNYIILGI